MEEGLLGSQNIGEIAVENTFDEGGDIADLWIPMFRQRMAISEHVFRDFSGEKREGVAEMDEALAADSDQACICIPQIHLFVCLLHSGWRRFKESCMESYGL